jgi:anti-sigma B factor antagonist
MIDVTVAGQAARMTLAGEYDVVNAHEIRLVASQLAAQGVAELEVDVSEVTFMGVAGLNALIEARCLFENRGRMVVVRPTAELRRLFELAAIDWALVGADA